MLITSNILGPIIGILVGVILVTIKEGDMSYTLTIILGLIALAMAVLVTVREYKRWKRKKLEKEGRQDESNSSKES